MILLNLETSTKNCSVSISKNNELLCLCEELGEQYIHSEKLHLFVEWALEGAEIKIKDIDAVSISKGPGSYTGLRIGASAAKGLCFALNKPLVSVESLEVLAQTKIMQGYDLIIPMIDARRMEVYTAIFDGEGNRISTTEAKILDENSFIDYKDKKIAFVGDGASKSKTVLQIPDAKFFDDIYPSAEFMIKLSEEKIQNEQFEDVAYFEPFYLKDFISGKASKNLI